MRGEASSPYSPISVPKTVRDRLPTSGPRKSGGADSIRVRDDPRIVYVYPLEKGAAWTSFTSPFLQTREVVGYEKVTVKADTFWCVKIATKIPELAPELEWVDYVARQGLVLRVLTSEREPRDAQNRPAGVPHTEERLQLTNKV